MKKIAHLSIALLYATSLTSAVFAGRADNSPDTSDVPAIPPQPDVSTETPTPDASADNQDDTTQNNQQNNSKTFNQGVAIGVAAGAAGAAVLGGTFAVKKIREKNKEIDDQKQINEKDEAIREEDVKIKEKEKTNTIEEHMQTIVLKDQIIEQQNQEIRKKDLHIKELNKNVNKKSNYINRVMKDIHNQIFKKEKGSEPDEISKKIHSQAYVAVIKGIQGNKEAVEKMTEQMNKTVKEQEQIRNSKVIQYRNLRDKYVKHLEEHVHMTE